MLPRGVYQSSHRFIDPLHKHSQEEDCSNGRSQVARHGLDVIKQLAALSCLDDGDPADADGNDAQNPDSGHGSGEQQGGHQSSEVLAQKLTLSTGWSLTCPQ